VSDISEQGNKHLGSIKRGEISGLHQRLPASWDEFYYSIELIMFNSTINRGYGCNWRCTTHLAAVTELLRFVHKYTVRPVCL